MHLNQIATVLGLSMTFINKPVGAIIKVVMDETSAGIKGHYCKERCLKIYKYKGVTPSSVALLLDGAGTTKTPSKTLVGQQKKIVDNLKCTTTYQLMK